MKKTLKIIGIIVGVLIIIMIVAPFVFKGPIERAVKKSINKNVNAKVEWQDLSLSLFSSFPNAQLSLKNVSVINKAPFEGDTLATSKEIALDMGIPQLFKGGDNISINQLSLDQAFINVKIDQQGRANYDIAKETATEEKPAQQKNNTSAKKEAPAENATQEGLSFDVQHYEINDSRINYLDEKAKTFLRITDFNHEGTGDFSAETSTLHTKTDAVVSFELDSVNYLNKNKLHLDADFKMDLANQQYTFLENKALINQLPLTFDGFVKINDNSNTIDLSFKTPSSDFKNFLAVIPETYAKNLNGVQTSGDFTVNGKIKGVVDDTHIPKLDIAVNSSNASFKYPDLPKTVKNINLDLLVKNETGIVEDTYINFNKLNFQIDQDVFSAHGNLKNLTQNMLVDLAVNGTLNLANLDKAYPIDTDMDLNGILKANLTTNFDMNSVEKEQYQNIKTNGQASLSNFSYASPEIPNKINISKAAISFNPQNIQLQQMQLSTGKTDASISGKLENFMGFLFADKPVKGNFDLQSNTFSVNDFMVAQTEEKPTKTTQKEEAAGTEKSEKKENSATAEAVKIPSFLDVQLNFKANKVLYDNLTLNDAKGSLLIKNETATLKDITANLLGGTLGIAGNVSTKNPTPTFNMEVGLQKIDIVESFKSLNLLQNLAPIAKALQGNLTTNLNLKGNLHNDLTPILTSLAGDAFAQILGAKVNPEKTPLLNKLNGDLNFLDLEKLNLKDIKTKLTFNDGKINVKPFDFNIKDIKITASGSHSFENTMNYNLKLDVPAKYLGSDVGSGLAKLSKTAMENTKVSLPVGLTGTFTNPHITVNMKQAVNNLTQSIVEKQKENLVNKAKNEVGNLLNKNKDTTKTNDQKKEDHDKLKKAAGKLMNGLFGKKKSEKEN